MRYTSAEPAQSFGKLHCKLMQASCLLIKIVLLADADSLLVFVLQADVDNLLGFVLQADVDNLLL